MAASKHLRHFLHPGATASMSVSVAASRQRFCSVLPDRVGDETTEHSFVSVLVSKCSRFYLFWLFVIDTKKTPEQLGQNNHLIQGPLEQIETSALY